MTAEENKTSVPGESGVVKDNPEEPGNHRDPEERRATCKEELREKMLDKTLADTFPTSDPPSTIPDPCGDDSLT